MNVTLMWLLLLPIGLGVPLWYVRRTHPNALGASIIFTLVSTVLVLLMFFLSRSAATSDIEIWNGQVTGKERVHGTYERPYECRCRQVQSCTGSGKDRSCTSRKECDTCYETRYTVNWRCDSSVGSYTIDSEDSSFRSVYSKPNPQRWEIIQKGDPVAKRSSYTNYVQAVPESLFTASSGSTKERFAKLIVPYPDQVYDIYKLNRFLTPGYSSPDTAAWNESISLMLRELGPQKQVNAIVVIAKTNDPNYEYALRDAWEGANKNDVVLIIGSAEWPKIDFVRVLTWSKSELFKVELRDSVLALGTIQREPIIQILQTQIQKNFTRRKMADLKYLESEIDPPTWLVILTVLVLISAAGGVWYVLRPMSRNVRRWR